MTPSATPRVLACLQAHPHGLTPCQIGNKTELSTHDARKVLANLMALGKVWMIANPCKGQAMLWVS